MQLTDLIPEAQSAIGSAEDIAICGLTADSRAVKPGFLFAALSGTQVDGAKFISDALERGAFAVLTHSTWKEALKTAPGSEELPILPVGNPRRELALAAARFYHLQPENVCAVTGTNGKTSIAGFTRQIWQQLGLRAASMGTLGVQSPQAYIPLGHTTPDPVQVHRTLNGLSLAGVENVVLEASSHGLAQYRLDGVKVSAAAFTNLTRDHLDYHESFDDYLFAKMRLFGEVMKPGSTAVINADAEAFADTEAVCWSRGIMVLSVGESKESDLHILSKRPGIDGQDVEFEWQGERFGIHLPLIGGFQASNALMAAGLAIATGAKAKKVFKTLENLRTINGRMELAGTSQSGASVLIDYAHTPDALETVLKAARPHAKGQLKVVFGCGGDRDSGKRSQMGAIAARLADVAIVTDDNPRSETPASIRAEILAGTKGGKANVMEVGDRALAVRGAIEGLGDNDLLIVAGKGHETGQVIGDITLPFNDLEVVKAALGANAPDRGEV